MLSTMDSGDPSWVHTVYTCGSDEHEAVASGHTDDNMTSLGDLHKKNIR